MRCAHFAEICEKCGNMRNMRESHICIKLARLSSNNYEQDACMANSYCLHYSEVDLGVFFVTSEIWHEKNLLEVPNFTIIDAGVGIWDPPKN